METTDTTAQRVRPAAIVMQPTEANEATGVTIQRTVGSERLVLLDPVLLLDHLKAELPAGIHSLGFPKHPHRGIETLTYVLSGQVNHRDSLGNNSTVGADSSQWMNAGSGIYHAEMLERGPDPALPIEAIQLWFNIPAASKMSDPAYRPATPETIPTVALASGATVKVVTGTFQGIAGAFSDIHARPMYLAVNLPAGATMTLPAPMGETAFAYVYRGSASFGEAEKPKTANAPQLVVFGEGDVVQVTALGTEDVAFIYVTAKPLQEPVLQYRSLVMNTVDQMGQALTDLEEGTFLRHSSVNAEF